MDTHAHKEMATIILEIYIGVHKKFALYLRVLRNHKMLHKIQLALVIINRKQKL